jgi:membrane-bound serine protease (ClpP class)
MSLILALYAMQTLPVNYAGFLFILLALILFIAEIKVASYGLLSLAGVLCLVLGSLMLFRFPGQPMPLALSVLIPTVVTISAFFIGVTTLALRAQRSVPKIGNEAFVGLVGEVVQDLHFEGKVFVNGELWNAQADETIPAGTRVRVVSVENLKLQVRRIDDN